MEPQEKNMVVADIWQNDLSHRGIVKRCGEEMFRHYAYEGCGDGSDYFLQALFGER